MRCPKCGFISFDHLDFCRKCNKPLGSVSVVLHGSVYDCQAPVFLRFSRPEGEMEHLDDPLANVVEEVEIEAPALDALSGRETARLVKSASAPLSGESAIIMGAAAMAQKPTPSGGQNAVPSAAPTWGEKAEPTAFLDKGEETPSFALAEEGMEIPPDLADISDLAPPGQPVEFTETEGEDDFDLDLDLDLGFDLRDLEDDTEPEEATELEEAEPALTADTHKGQAAPVDMDSDLDFELDLGGLSLHDYGDNRK